MNIKEAPMKGDDNVGDTTKTSTGEVNRKVDSYRNDFLRVTGKLGQEFRLNRTRTDNLNTRFWIVIGVIVAVLTWFNYLNKPVMAMKTITIDEAEAAAQNKRKER